MILQGEPDVVDLGHLNPYRTEGGFQCHFHDLLRSPDDQAPGPATVKILGLNEDFPRLGEEALGHLTVRHRLKISPGL